MMFWVIETELYNLLCQFCISIFPEDVLSLMFAVTVGARGSNSSSILVFVVVVCLLPY